MPALSHISQTQIAMWQRCPRQWEYSYVRGIKIPPSGALIEGNCYHKALEVNFKQKIYTEEDLSAADCSDIFSSAWDRAVSREELIDWGNLVPGSVKDQGIGLVGAYIETVAPAVHPKHVEQWCNSEVAGVGFKLRADLIDIDDEVIDHKTSAKMLNQDDVDKDLQASATAFALDRAIIFKYHVAVKTKKPGIQIIQTIRGTADIDWWIDMTARIIIQMKSGIAPPNPTSRLCSPGFCGYWIMCRGDLERKVYL